MITWKAWVGAAGMMLAAVTAIAADAKPADKPVDTPQAMLDRMDRDVDGKISLEEYRNAMVRRFGARDLNDDGVLQGDEYPKEWLAGADAQQATGKVSWEDFEAQLPLVFDRFDANKDGLLDAAEIAAFAGARKSQKESRK
jgi:Ca2+-binding EF-hand superfamily protein